MSDSNATADELREIGKRSKNAATKAACTRAAGMLECFSILVTENTELVARIDEAWKLSGSNKIREDQSSMYNYRIDHRLPSSIEKPGVLASACSNAIREKEELWDQLKRVERFLNFLHREGTCESVGAFMSAERMKFDDPTSGATL